MTTPALRVFNLAFGSHPRGRAPLPFWSRVQRGGPDECWPWLGSKNHKGYGFLARYREGRMRYLRATHIAWELANAKPWPGGLFALHSCDNPPCVNPAHIRPGTPAENAADRRARGKPPKPRPEKKGRPWATGLCQRGHELTPENISMGGPKRRCRLCKNERARRYAREARRLTPRGRRSPPVAPSPEMMELI